MKLIGAVLMRLADVRRVANVAGCLKRLAVRQLR